MAYNRGMDDNGSGLRMVKEVENAVEANLDLAEGDKVEVLDDIELVYDYGDLEVIIESMPKPAYYVEFRKAGDPLSKVRKGTFHSDYIGQFKKIMAEHNVVLITLRRESDKKVIFSRRTQA